MKLIKITIFIFLFHTQLLAQDFYVSIFNTSLYSRPYKKSAKILNLKKGAKLTLIKKSRSNEIWLKVKYKKKAGWIPVFFVSQEKPLSKDELIQGVRYNSRVRVRQRVSSQVEKKPDKSNDFNDKSNQIKSRFGERFSKISETEALKFMENHYFTESKLLKFLRQAGIK